MSVNSVSLTGRAGRDPEARYFEDGKVVANLTLAVSNPYGKTEEDKTYWFDLEIWGKSAQVAVDYVRKGSLIGITGTLKQSKWVDKESGSNRSKVLISVNQLTLLETKAQSEARASGESTAAAPAAPASASPFGAPADDADDIPF